MNKKVTNLLLAFFLIFTLSGCVKFNANMDIKKDKSMDFEIIYAIDTSYFGEEEMITEVEKQELEKEGFVVSDYLEGNMKGITISRKVKNIDIVSSTEDTTYSLSNILESSDSNESNSYLFKVKKGLFKNTYKAELHFDSSNSDLNDSLESTDEETLELEEPIEEVESTIEDDYTYDDSTSSSNSFDDLDFNGMSEMDLSYNVTLPYAALSNNATEVSNDGKTLKWELTTDSVNVMEFEFELYNMTNIYICIGVGIVLILGLIILVAKKKGKKQKNNANSNLESTTEQSIQNNMSPNSETTNIQPTTTDVPNSIQSSTMQNTPVPSNTVETVATTQNINYTNELVQPSASPIPQQEVVTSVNNSIYNEPVPPIEPTTMEVGQQNMNPTNEVAQNQIPQVSVPVTPTMAAQEPASTLNNSVPNVSIPIPAPQIISSNASSMVPEQNPQNINFGQLNQSNLNISQNQISQQPNPVQVSFEQNNQPTSQNNNLNNQNLN